MTCFAVVDRINSADHCNSNKVIDMQTLLRILQEKDKLILSMADRISSLEYKVNSIDDRITRKNGLLYL